MTKDLKEDIAEAFAELRYRPVTGCVCRGDFFDSAMNTLLHAKDLMEAGKVLAYLNFFLSRQDDICRMYASCGIEIDAMISGHAHTLSLVPDDKTRNVCFVTNAVADSEDSIYCVSHAENETYVSEDDPFEDLLGTGAQGTGGQGAAATLYREQRIEIGMVSRWYTLTQDGGKIATGRDKEYCIVPNSRSADKAKLYDSRGGYALEYDSRHDVVCINDRNCRYTVVYDDGAMELYDRMYIERLRKGTAPARSRMLASIRWCKTDGNDRTGIARIELQHTAGSVDPDFPILLAASALIMNRKMHTD